MLDLRAALAVVGCALLIMAGCGSPTPGPSGETEGPPVAAADDTATAVPEPPVAGQPDEPETTPPEPDSDPPPESPDPAPAGAQPAVVDPGGFVEVTQAIEGLTRIGVDKCKICHKLQHASWAETAHARRDLPLDCEGCHGAGSEYKGMAVMKDPAASRAAGLVDPGPEFCATCHRSGWNDDMMTRAHAHKES